MILGLEKVCFPVKFKNASVHFERGGIFVDCTKMM